jgi:tyrosyl-tRNA synthetase
MKLIALATLLSFSLSSIHAQDNLTTTLKNAGLISKIISKDESYSAILKDKKSVIIWGVAATTPSLHLGHLASLNLLKKYQDAGHFVIIYIDDTFAGFDPSNKSMTQLTDRESSQKNSLLIQKQIKQVLGSNISLYLFSEFSPNISLIDIMNYAPYLDIEERKENLKHMNKPTLRDFIFPFIDAHYNLLLLNKKNIRNAIYVMGEDQIPNAIFIEIFMSGHNKNTIFLIHPLIRFNDNKKISKSQDIQSIRLVPFINDSNAIKEFITNQPDDQIELLWNFFSSNTPPQDPKKAKKELLAKILDQLNF